jgi:two-component system chemotaxis response regulator CheB
MQATHRQGDLRGVVAIGASAGGVEALSNLAQSLSPDLPYAFLVALHIPPSAPSLLARIINRSGPLSAATAEHGTRLEPGHIYVAQPDHHLLVTDHRMVLSRGPTENGHRPAINALFRSVALQFGPRAIAVLLSGVLDDGVLGLEAIRSRGGVTIGQTPADALFPAMPKNAAAAGVLDRQARAADIGAMLEELAQRKIEELTLERDIAMELENRIAMSTPFATNFDTQALGSASGYTCPDCNGSLTKIAMDNFRCHVGHAWSPDSLLVARDDEVQNALWIALRSLQEKSKLARQLAEKAGKGLVFQRYTALADETERALAVLGERLAAADPRLGEVGG